MIEFIVGGARSGKSRHALQKANDFQNLHGGKKVFVATGTAGDGEMNKRIRQHQKERDQSWSLVEEPLYLSGILQSLDQKDVVLIDCLTLWITNWLCSEKSENWPDEKGRFLSALEKSDTEVLIVSNEVGQGVTPMGELSRNFVDECGWLHQQIAALSHQVTLMQLGIPKVIKP